MNNDKDQTGEGLNQIFEIINAKGDEGELRQIAEKNDSSVNQTQNQYQKQEPGQ